MGCKRAATLCIGLKKKKKLYQQWYGRTIRSDVAADSLQKPTFMLVELSAFRPSPGRVLRYVHRYVFLHTFDCELLCNWELLFVHENIFLVRRESMVHDKTPTAIPGQPYPYL